MRIRFFPVWLVARRELRDQMRDWRIMFPLIVLTLVFPAMMYFVAGTAVDFVTRYGGQLILDRLVPFAILIIGFFPITISLVVALESFVGEKERGTIEPLLSTPLADWQLYFGKLLAGMLPPLLASYISIGLFLIVVAFQDITMPAINVILKLLVLAAVHAILMVSGAIVISTQSTSVRAANLLASFIVIPVAFLIQWESALIFWGNDQLLWLAMLGVVLLATLLIRVGVSHFQREYLLGREIDTINLRWIGKTFWHNFVGESHSFSNWYRKELGRTLHKLWLPLVLIVGLSAFGIAYSYLWTLSNAPALIAKASTKDIAELQSQLPRALDFAPIDFQLNFLTLLWHNLRAILITLLLSLFTFGVLGMLGLFANMGVIGGFLAVLKLIGFSPWTMTWAGLLPHGIFEIPAILLSTAAILRLGAVLVTPNPDYTIGEVFIIALADWTKIFVGLIIPLLTVAAIVETYVTPALLLSALG